MNTLKKKVAAFNSMLSDTEESLRNSTEQVATLTEQLQKAIDEGDSKGAIAYQRKLASAEADRAAAAEVYRSVSARNALTVSEIRAQFRIRQEAMGRELNPLTGKIDKQLESLKAAYAEYFAVYNKLEAEAETWQELAPYTAEGRKGQAVFNFVPPRFELHFEIKDFIDRFARG